MAAWRPAQLQELRASVLCHAARVRVCGRTLGRSRILGGHQSALLQAEGVRAGGRNGMSRPPHCESSRHNEVSCYLPCSFHVCSCVMLCHKLQLETIPGQEKMNMNT